MIESTFQCLRALRETKSLGDPKLHRRRCKNALQSANEWSPPPPPAKSNQYKAYRPTGPTVFAFIVGKSLDSLKFSTSFLITDTISCHHYLCTSSDEIHPTTTTTTLSSSSSSSWRQQPFAMKCHPISPHAGCLPTAAGCSAVTFGSFSTAIDDAPWRCGMCLVSGAQVLLKLGGVQVELLGIT